MRLELVCKGTNLLPTRLILHILFISYYVNEINVTICYMGWVWQVHFGRIVMDLFNIWNNVKTNPHGAKASQVISLNISNLSSPF